VATDATSKKTLTTPADVVEFARASGAQFVDYKFVDLPGTWQHISAPIKYLDEEKFEKGQGFDGSSIRGFQKIHESDMLLMPDPTTAIMDPVGKVPTISIICDVKDPVTGALYSRDPRGVAKKAERHLISSGIANQSYWGPEAEFFLFQDVRYGQDTHSGFYSVDAEEGIWNSAANSKPNLGHRPRTKEGYFPVPPTDSLQDIRSEMVLKMIECGIDVELHHHEVASAGQCEIDMRFSSLVKMADQLLLYKYIIKNVALANGMTATFMPKPLFGDNGSGMHVHQSLWKDGTNLFYDAKGYALLSKTARNYIGGLLKHAPALLAFAAPTTNSYRRLVPGFEAPVNLMYSQRNRSAACRIPMYSNSPASKRIEFRCPDATCNPYLTFSALLMAGLDGVRNEIEPPDPIDKDLYELEAEEAAKITSTPGSLGEVLNSLEADHEFLLEGGVFTKDLVANYIAYKRDREVDPMALRPHPYEFHLYYDA
jgi:glutamine synthetase